MDELPRQRVDFMGMTQPQVQPNLNIGSGMLGAGAAQPTSTISNALTMAQNPASVGSSSTSGMSSDQIASTAEASQAGLSAANKILGTLLLLNENSKNRGVEEREFAANQDLSRKAMVLQYLTGNNDYRDKLNTLMIRLSKKGRKRSADLSGQADLQASSTYGR